MVIYSALRLNLIIIDYEGEVRPPDVSENKVYLLMFTVQTMPGVVAASGVLRTLTLLLKHGRREDLVTYGQYSVT